MNDAPARVAPPAATRGAQLGACRQPPATLGLPKPMSRACKQAASPTPLRPGSRPACHRPQPQQPPMQAVRAAPQTPTSPSSHALDPAGAHLPPITLLEAAGQAGGSPLACQETGPSRKWPRARAAARACGSGGSARPRNRPTNTSPLKNPQRINHTRSRRWAPASTASAPWNHRRAHTVGCAWQPRRCDTCWYSACEHRRTGRPHAGAKERALLQTPGIQPQRRAGAACCCGAAGNTEERRRRIRAARAWLLATSARAWGLETAVMGAVNCVVRQHARAQVCPRWLGACRCWGRLKRSLCAHIARARYRGVRGSLMAQGFAPARAGADDTESRGTYTSTHTHMLF